MASMIAGSVTGVPTGVPRAIVDLASVGRRRPPGPVERVIVPAEAHP